MKNIFYLLIILSCSGPAKEGLSMSSHSLEFSKKHHLFISQYKPSIDYFDTDIGRIYIKDVWIDHGWHYTDQLRNIEKESSISMNVTFKENTLLEKIDVSDYSQSAFHGKGICYYLKQSRVNQDTIKMIYYKTPHYNIYSNRKKTDSVNVLLVRVK